jgi:monoamine oxidase
MTDVLIIEEELQDLMAVRKLHRRGLSVQLIEASDRVGGRVKPIS